MFVFRRAAAYAVAAILACASPTLATPSLAINPGVTPVSIHHLSHAVAEVQVAPVDALAPVTEVPVVATPPAPVSEPVTLAPAAPVLKAKSLTELVNLHDDASADTAELECLATAIYFESKGEPLEGQLAVAEVVLNRSRSGKYPRTLCGVVKQRHQFSFVRGGRFPPIARNSAPWRKAVAIAHIAVADLADSRAEDAMFFHATYVRPGWRGLKRVAQVGNHIFYR